MNKGEKKVMGIKMLQHTTVALCTPEVCHLSTKNSLSYQSCSPVAHSSLFNLGCFYVTDHMIYLALMWLK